MDIKKVNLKACFKVTLNGDDVTNKLSYDLCNKTVTISMVGIDYIQFHNILSSDVSFEIVLILCTKKMELDSTITFLNCKLISHFSELDISDAGMVEHTATFSFLSTKTEEL